jgi:hypothetical protein
MTVAKISLVLAIYFGAIPASILFAHSRGELSLGLLFILAWVVAPYALLALTARFGQFPAVTIGSLVLMIITGLFGSFVYIDSYFHIWSDQQDSLRRLADLSRLRRTPLAWTARRHRGVACET